MEDNPSELVTSNQQNQNQNSGQYVSCNIYQRTFKTNTVLLQHPSLCRRRIREYNINSNNAINDNNNIAADNDNSNRHESSGNGSHETYFWNEVRGAVFEKCLTNVYEKVVHWKRNLFMMASGAVGKKYINEITRFSIQDSLLNTIALKATHTIPAFLL